MSATDSGHVAAMRAFNRFYTRRIGVLHERLLHSDFTLPQSRLLWELAHHDGVTASTLARELDLDAGYLSRLLAGLKDQGLVRATRSSDEAFTTSICSMARHRGATPRRSSFTLPIASALLGNSATVATRLSLRSTWHSSSMACRWPRLS